MARKYLLAAVVLGFVVTMVPAEDGYVTYCNTNKRKEAPKMPLAKLVTVTAKEAVNDGTKVIGYDLTLHPKGKKDPLPGKYRIGVKGMMRVYTFPNRTSSELYLERIKKDVDIAVVLEKDDKGVITVKGMFHKDVFTSTEK